MTGAGEVAYDALPVDPRFPPGSSWGVFGADDESGTLNRLNPEAVLAAASGLREGRVFPLSWSVDLPDPGFYGRDAPRHTVTYDGYATDDRYDAYFPQNSSQWDALCHIRNREHGYYNAVPDEETPGGGGGRLAIDVWAQRGIAGRFLLLDVAGHRERAGTPIEHGRRTDVAPDELDAILRDQATQPRRGDVLLLHFGWTEWFERLDGADRGRYAAGRFASPGLAPVEATARWLWDRGFAAVAADNPAVESTPSSGRSLHERLIPLLGFAIGELFQLGPLAAHCTATSRYTGLFVASPLRKPRGAGSPANATAIV